MPPRNTGAPSVPIARASRPGSLTPTSAWLPIDDHRLVRAAQRLRGLLDRVVAAELRHPDR